MKKKIPEYLLLPLSGIYGLSVYIRNKMFDWQILPSKEYPLPVISVGNIRVGGTGKTPHTEYLIRLLKDEFRVAVLSRGYKRKTHGFFLANEGSDPGQIGDEPCQMKNKFPEIIVAVDEKRSRGIKKLMELNPGPDIILLDDAFQHRYVKPGLSILLDDFNNPMREDSLLPFGRLREPWTAKQRANIILVTKSPPRLKAIDMRIRARDTRLNEFQHLFYTTIRANNVNPVFNGDFNKFKEKKPGILLISGIANPRSLKPLARKISTEISEMIFSDHHIYTENDIDNILNKYKQLDTSNSIILTTEKDAVKLRQIPDRFNSISDKMFYISIEIEFLNKDQEQFDKQIINYVRSNKRDSVLHKSQG